MSTASYLTPSAFTDLQWQIRGVSDFDGDGKVDILWHHQQTGDLYVWLMGGNGTVVVGGVYLSPSAFSDTTWQIRGVTNLNGDRQPDILWRQTTTGTNYAWLMSGTTGATGAYTTPATIGTNWQIRMVSDFNGDQQADILWQDQGTGDLYVWYLNASLVVTGGSYLTPRTQSDANWWVTPR